MTDHQVEISQWDSDEMIIWKDEATSLQTEFYRTYCDKIWWSGIPETNKNQLQQVIGQVIYGPAPVDDQLDLRKAGYKRKEAARIKIVARRIAKHFQSETSLSVVFICAKLRKVSHTEQVFRVWDTEKEGFIDAGGRIYKDWTSFLKENTFPQCYLCFPTDGYYKLNTSGRAVVEFIETPSSSFKNRLLSILDIFSLMLSLIAAIMYIDAAIQGDNVIYIVATVVLLIGFPYRLFRFGYSLRDTCKHI